MPDFVKNKANLNSAVTAVSTGANSVVVPKS